MDDLKRDIINSLHCDFSDVERNIDRKLDNLKDMILGELKTDLKNKVVKVWKDGTNKFYHEARSHLSNHSYIGDGQSDISGLSRSRSESRDILMKSYSHNNHQ